MGAAGDRHARQAALVDRRAPGLPTAAHVVDAAAARLPAAGQARGHRCVLRLSAGDELGGRQSGAPADDAGADATDRKSTRLNSSHTVISYAVFCLKKKKKINTS